MSYSIYKAVLISYLEIRFKEYDTWDNYYIEIRTFEEGNVTEKRQIWYRNNKYKIIIYSYFEKQQENIIYKWIDCNTDKVIERDKNNTLIEYTGKNNLYDNGKLIKKYLFWIEQIKNDKIRTIFNIKTLYFIKENINDKLVTDNKTTKFKSNSIIPEIYIDKSEHKNKYWYYKIELNNVLNEDVEYKSDL